MNQVARSEMQAIQDGYARMAPAVAKMLPSHISPEKFERAAMVAIQRNPDLLRANRTSLFLSLQRAAQDGLIPDGREGAIVTFGQQAQWMPMVAGLMKLARNSGEIASINAHVAYEGEKFRVILGDEEAIEHERSLDLADNAKAIAVYAVATLKSGEKIREIMTHKQIEKVRGVSKTGKSGPWVAWWDEMARKSAIRRLSKRLPLSTDRDADNRLDSAIRNEGVIDGQAFVSPEEAAQVSGPALSVPEGESRLDQLEGALTSEAEPVPVDERREMPAQAQQADAFPGDLPEGSGKPYRR